LYVTCCLACSWHFAAVKSLYLSGLLKCFIHKYFSSDVLPGPVVFQSSPDSDTCQQSCSHTSPSDNKSRFHTLPERCQLRSKNY
jgi:hypothetical protein